MEKFKKYFSYILVFIAIIILLMGDKYLDKYHNFLLSIISIMIIIFFTNTSKCFGRTQRIIITITFISLLISKIYLYFMV